MSRWIMATIIWIVLQLFGFGLLLEYKRTPGSVGIGGQLCSSETDGLPRLYLFLMPNCPCSAASLDALDRLITRYPHEFTTRVVLSDHRRETVADWGYPLKARAASLPDTQVTPMSREMAVSFGVQTSGHVLFFDRTGKLLFSGGMTDSRGHFGDSISSQQLEVCVQGKIDRLVRTNVYGCLFEGSFYSSSGSRE